LSGVATSETTRSRALSHAWRGRNVNLRGVLIASAVLLALGFALTFPPIFAVFAPK
jgi:hypothetical protein